MYSWLAGLNTPNGFENVSSNFTVGMDDLVENHTVNLIIGSICFCINIVLFLILTTNKQFRRKYKLLLFLNIADALNCIGIATMGANRVDMYQNIIDTLTIPIRNSWDCAVEPWLWLRVIGDLWPPIIQVIMGLERFLAVFCPVFYRNRVETKKYKNHVFAIVSIVFVVASLVVGFSISWAARGKWQKYYCGRKAAFSDGYGTYIYATNIIGYTVGASMNTCAYVRARRSKTAKAQLVRIRYYLMISLLSLVLVSTPNFISLFSVFFGSVNAAISKPAVWATCINSGLALFVYTALNPEFRSRLSHICSVRISVSIDTRPKQVAAASMTPSRFVTGTTMHSRSPEANKLPKDDAEPQPEPKEERCPYTTSTSLQPSTADILPRPM